ncbi:hypothetical protein PUN28_015338 [Cardiocondyla obscurior]|uniref:Uncharacterized protein n=1 Tax=Cardiocondyla obscurior TaxID=286306 RepID=A0AAW2ESH1_9HYME
MRLLIQMFSDVIIVKVRSHSITLFVQLLQLYATWKYKLIFRKRIHHVSFHTLFSPSKFFAMYRTYSIALAISVFFGHFLKARKKYEKPFDMTRPVIKL